MSRLSLTIKNGWIALVFQLLYIIVQFFSRNIFLENLGDDFVGTEGTLKSILMFLNLSELGIGTAIGFALYKPIFEDDKEKIDEIIGYLGYLYKKIGAFVLFSGFILLVLFPFFFQNSSINIWYIIFLFASLLIGNLLNYFFNYQMFLLEADQKVYVRTTIYNLMYIIKLVVQCVILIYLKSILLWIFLELLSSIIYVLILRKKIKKLYPWLSFSYRITDPIKKQNRPLLKKIKQIGFHKLGSFVSTGTDNIIIFSLINPATVAFVGNYQMVMGNLNILVSKLFEGTKASVGNLVAENDIRNILKVFWEMMALRFFFAGTSSLLLFFGFDNFITIWLGDKYLLSSKILLSLTIIFFILQVRQPVDDFKQAYGLYDDIWSPVIQSIINLIISIVLVIKYGIIGVFIGTIVSQIIIVMLWRPYYLFSKGFKMSSINYWKGFSFHLILFSIAVIAFSHFFSMDKSNNPKNIFELILKLSKLGIIFSVLYCIILFILSKGFKDLVNRFYMLIKTKI